MAVRLRIDFFILVAEFSARGGDEIWVHVTVNANFMEGVLLIVRTGFAPGSIYGLTLFVHGYFAICTSLDPVRSF